MQPLAAKDLAELTRHEKLWEWMRLTGVRAQHIADCMGLTPGYVLCMLKKKTIPARRFARLVFIGVPVELLPLPLEQPHGKPRPTLLEINVASSHQKPPTTKP